MKTTISIFFIFLTSLIINAQVCDSYYPSGAGSTWEITNYNAKDKPESVQKSKILSAEASNGGILYTISASYYDTKEKETGNQTFTTFCKDGLLSIDMKSMLSPESFQGSDVEMQIEAQNLDLPSKLTAGQKLPDSWIKISFQMEGMGIMGQTVNIKNRIVEKFETITTSAGTFECVKINYDTEIQSMFSMTFKTSAWFAMGVGMIRSETFDSKGKLQSYSVLTAFSK